MSDARRCIVRQQSVGDTVFEYEAQGFQFVVESPSLVLLAPACCPLLAVEFGNPVGGFPSEPSQANFDNPATAGMR